MIAMVVGIAGFKVFRILMPLLPPLIFFMLFFAFCRVNPKFLRFHRWHWAVLLTQIPLAIGSYYLIMSLPEMIASQEILAQGVMLCFLMPTATAAPIIAAKLGGDLESLTSFTLLTNILTAIIVPLFFPVINPMEGLTFWSAAWTLLQRVGPLLLGPFFCFHPIRDYDQFVGKTMEFKIVKINQEFRNVVVSHKALIEAELEAQKKEIIGKLEKGQILEGVVKNITSYGVFVDLGGVDGLIHITDLSWGRVDDPHKVVELDQKINVVILDFDDEKRRIALGLKQLTPHPWDALDADLKVGDHVKGKVVVIADYGAFVEIQPGVEGLIHVSEMSWSQHLRSAQEFLKVGDDIEAVILTLDRDERKMSLGIKQLKEDPWEAIEVKYPVGSKHTAKVRNFTNFGVFVELEEGVDGLIHISDLSWTKKVKHPSEFTQVGAEIDVLVLDIDKENRRLSLGHKQLEENPWDVFEEKYTVGSIHEGKITELLEKGAVVALDENVEGFATPKHLQKEDGSQAVQGEVLPFKVIEFNKDSKRIILSHSRTFEDPAREEKRAAAKKARAPKKDDAPKIENVAASTTLGDIDVLAQLKAQMEKGE